MRILFMGTPDFAAESLRAMICANMNVVGAISQPDKPKGRGHKLVPTEVKALAEEANIAVYQPEKLKDNEILPLLRELKPDLIVVTAYGKILPKYIIDYPKYGCINVHASLLPKYRGAAPIQWAIINGEATTGVTTMKMDEGLDTGDILLVKETRIGEEETAEQLFDRLAKLGGELLVETIKNIESITPKRQNDDEYTYAPVLNKEMGKIDWSKSAKEISNLIRGLNSWPLAYTTYENEIVKIVKAKAVEGSGEAGTILEMRKGEGLIVACGKDALCIKIAQFPNSKKMNIEDYARGHKIEIGAVLK